MKRTLLVTIDFPPMFGGVANYWANLSRFMPSGDFVVLASECDDSLDFDIKQNYLVYRKILISKNEWLWPKWLPLLFQMYKTVRQEKIEKIIVTHVLPAGTAAYLIKRLLRIPYIVSAHGLDVEFAKATGRKRKLAKRIFKNADKILANSRFTKQLVLDLIDCPDDKVELVYPCPNIKAQNIGQLPLERLADQFAGRRVILAVGRLVERKGQDKVIQALPKVLAKVPDAFYVIIGRGENKSYLEELIKLKKLENNVWIGDDVDSYELPAFYQVCDVFIMPSRQLENGDIEGFGIVYLEANSFGKPVVAGRTGGVVDAVEHGVNGLLVDPNNVDEIADALISLLTDKDKAWTLGEKGRVRVINKFNWEEQARKVVDLLK